MRLYLKTLNELCSEEIKMPGAVKLDDNGNPLPDDQNTNPTVTKPTTDEDLVEKLVKERLAASLAEIKGKLDSSYAARDEALRKAAELEAKERERELKRLEDEGKHKEAFEIRLAEEKAARAVAEKRNIELTRDLEVKNALANLPLRSTRASDLAFDDITRELVQNDKGVWVHRSGVSIKDFVKTFADNEDNSFLFKPKTNSGGGTTTITPGSTTTPKSLFAMSQAEVMKLASEGKLPKRK
jgi:hypothetical protein